MPFAIAVEQSQNSKLGNGAMSTTYASIHSCPDVCPFKTTGACYGHNGPPAATWKRLNTIDIDIVKIAEEEAKAIDNLSGKYHLRIHTLGDCQTNETAQIVSSSSEKFMSKHGKKAFTYTHSWRTVDRESWKNVSILASCETPQECIQAMNKGYAASIVVSDFDKHSFYIKDNVRFVPCPKQIGRKDSCLTCKMCMKDKSLLKTKTVVAFKAHGPSRKCKSVLINKNQGDSK